MNKEIITEEMRFCQRVCEYAKKHGVTKAARKYHLNRMFIYRQFDKWDGSVRSLALKPRTPKPRTPKHSPFKHSPEELSLIYDNYIKHGLYGLAEVYVRSKEIGYNRSFGSMCRQIRLGNVNPVRKGKKIYLKYDRVDGKHIGDKVQVDLKYVPQECINFSCYGKKYYQITAIDEYSRKRILAIVEEKSTYETDKFLLELDKLFGFPIKTIQVDNGTEFVNDREITDKKSFFEEAAEIKGYTIRRIRPCSPWQKFNCVPFYITCNISLDS